MRLGDNTTLLGAVWQIRACWHPPWLGYLSATEVSREPDTDHRYLTPSTQFVGIVLLSTKNQTLCCITGLIFLEIKTLGTHFRNCHDNLKNHFITTERGKNDTKSNDWNIEEIDFFFYYNTNILIFDEWHTWLSLLFFVLLFFFFWCSYTVRTQQFLS